MKASGRRLEDQQMFAGSVSKIAKTFDLQDDTKLAHEVKCMYNKAYISICFLFLGKKFFTQTKLTFVKISLNFLLEVLIMY